MITFSHTQENVSLLKEINDLRTELKKSRSLAHDQEAVLKIARKQGFDDQAALATTKTLAPQTGIAKVEPTDNSRIIEMQKIEISRLRAKIKELDPSLRLSAGERLPPVHTTASISAH